MATILGQNGKVKVSNKTIAEVKSFSIEETADTIDTTVMGDQYKKFRAGKTSWSGSIEAYWDETDTDGQLNFKIGTEINLELYPDSDDVGKVKYSGIAYITGITKQLAQDGVGEISFNFQGSGALSRGFIVADNSNETNNNETNNNETNNGGNETGNETPPNDDDDLDDGDNNG